MAKTRAQRKAERRARQAREARETQRASREEGRAQQATQVPESGEVAEAEAVLETGAAPEELGETVRPAPEPEPEPEPAAPEPEPAAPAPSRADVGAPPAEPKESRRERRRREREERRLKEERRKARERPVAEPQERQRGAVTGFLVSCWAELKRVQWPDRETLVQASAVTLVFITIAAAYLGALDLVFNWLVQRII